jgi:uncharacterized membrane protein YbhN (UPF0104 family)
VRQRVIALTNVVFWVGIAYACVAFVLPKWREAQLSERLASLPATYLIMAVALFTCQYIAIYQLWLLTLRILGASPSAWTTFYAYALSLLPRYVPGKLLAQGMRLRLALAAGIPAPLVVASLAAEAVFGFASAVAIVALGVALGTTGELAAPARWVLISFVVIAVAGAVLLWLPVFGARLRSFLSTLQFTRKPAVPALLGLYVANWTLAMMAHWALARAIAPVPSGQLFPLLVALCVSWGVGTLSFVAPAGLGVREGVLLLFVRNWMGTTDALLFVTLSRVCAFGVELLLTAVASGVKLAVPVTSEASKPT